MEAFYILTEKSNSAKKLNLGKNLIFFKESIQQCILQIIKYKNKEYTSIRKTN